jgi:hypothetical protein
MNAVDLARDGVNTVCVDCGDRPYAGGMRCLSCFQARVHEKRGEHMFGEPASNATYGRGCRCRPCRDAAAADTRQRRARKKAAA